ncbi:MAG: hypothetical protein EXR49_04995 [Dehalococcoidia bacterium]|nr:hypothetical protein [Dehalococcoidia bacterium]
MTTPQKKPLSPEAALEMIRIAGFDVTPEQLARLSVDLDSMARNVARLEEVDVSVVEPAVIFRVPQQPERARRKRGA